MIGPNVESVNGQAHYKIEEHLKKSGLQWCILSPGLFMQNIMGQAASIKNDGKIVQPWPKDLPVALIDVRDTGALGARVLREPAKHAGKLYTFTGVSTTFGDFAKVIGEVMGKPITYVEVTLEQAEAAMKARNMPDWLVAHLVSIARAGARARSRRRTPSRSAISSAARRSRRGSSCRISRARSAERRCCSEAAQS